MTDHKVFKATRRNPHLTHKGQPKYRHKSWQSARRRAAAMTAETGVIYAPYQCATCKCFHVGRALLHLSNAAAREEWILELGPRVALHLAHENHFRRDRRWSAVLDRCRVIDRRRRQAAA